MIDTPAAGAVPAAVQRSYLCWIGASAVYFLGTLGLVAIPSGRNDGLPDPYDETLAGATLLVVGDLVLAGVVVLVAGSMHAGRQWARIALTAFGALAVQANALDAADFSLLRSDGQAVEGGTRTIVVVVAATITLLLLLAALVQQWLPAAAPHFEPAAPAGRRNAPTDAAVAPGMSTEADLHALLADARQGVLATIKRDGRPQLSPVTPFHDRPAGTILISMTEGRAKTANLRRDPRAALEVESTDGWAWATAEGSVELVGPGTDPNGPEVDALVAYYRAAAGEHPDWDEYRAVMVSDRRVLATLRVDRVYGQRIR